MDFCKNVTSCTADPCTDFLCFDSTTGILTANPPDDPGISIGAIGSSYLVIRCAQLWLSSLYWQKERELLSVKRGERNKDDIYKQMRLQFGRSILSTVGFYLLIQQSLYLFIALIALDTAFVPLRMYRLIEKDNTHPVQNVLVELWYLYDEAHQKIDHSETLDQLGKLIELMKNERNEKLPVVMAEVARSQITKRNLSF